MMVAKWIGGAVVAIALIYLALLFVAHDGPPDFHRIDACLDDGRRWNYERERCE